MNNIAKLSERIDDHNNRISTLLEEENLKCKNQILKLDRRIDDIEQKGRAHNIQIDGIPEVNQENLRNVIPALPTALKITLKDDDITYVARVRSTNKDKIKPIICSLSNFNIMAELIKASRKEKPTTKDIGFSNNNNIFINEHLTIARKQLLYKAKQFKTANKFEFLWVKDGKIFLKKIKTLKQSISM